MTMPRWSQRRECEYALWAARLLSSAYAEDSQRADDAPDRAEAVQMIEAALWARRRLLRRHRVIALVLAAVAAAILVGSVARHRVTSGRLDPPGRRAR